jgi:membrane fusion protein, copper/silver efflux system
MKLRPCLVASSLALLVCAALVSLGVFAPHAHAAEQLYSCGMHPQVIKPEPGNCPICGMKLTPLRATDKGGAAATQGGPRKIRFYKSTMVPGEISERAGKDSHGMDMVPVYEDEIDPASVITIDPITIQKMNLKTDVVRAGPVRRTIRAVGTVAFNEEGLVDITTKYEGWIEKLFVNATWATVKAGEPLFEIYSPDLYNAQLNYLVALRSEGEKGGPLTNAARARLQLFDLSDEFLAELAHAGEVRRNVVYRAPVDGVVVEKPAVRGMMVRPGEKIFRLADLSTVWVTAQIYEKDLALVRTGQQASVRSTYGSGHEVEGTVDLVIPEVLAETRTAQARLTLPNENRTLKPGMFVDVRFEAELAPSAVLVPDSAVLRSGERNTVFIAHDSGTFEPRTIELGPRTQDNFYAVRSGLEVGDRVVTSGQFMLDSESQLREAVQKMIRAMQGGGGAQPGVSSASGSRDSSGAASAPLLPETAKKPFTEFALILADASAALAADDVAKYRQHLPAVRKALEAYFAADEHAAHGPLAKYRRGLSDSGDIEAARREFEPLSTAVADLAVANHLHHSAGLHVFECPMTPVLGTGRWVQRNADLRNPFFGSEMLTCGAPVE